MGNDNNMFVDDETVSCGSNVQIPLLFVGQQNYFPVFLLPICTRISRFSMVQLLKSHWLKQSAFFSL